MTPTAMLHHSRQAAAAPLPLCGANPTFPLLLSWSALLRLLGVGVQAILRVFDAVVLPEGLV